MMRKMTTLWMQTILLCLCQAAARAEADGIYLDAQTLKMTHRVLSENKSEAEAAITEFRDMGSAGFTTLWFAFSSEILKRQGTESPSADDPQDEVRWQKISYVLDKVAAQKDVYASRLYWHTAFRTAKEEARSSGRPILSLRLLGRLDEDQSCANSRFFRSLLYANQEISQFLSTNFVLHWESVRPVPKVTIDFGDGRRIERTMTGNSIHYIVTPGGSVVDGLPGLYSPQAFLAWLHEVKLAAGRVSEMEAKGETPDTWLRDYHASRLHSLNRKFAALQQASGIFIDGTSMNLSSDHDVASASRATAMSLSKKLVEAPILKHIIDWEHVEQNESIADWRKLSRNEMDAIEFDANTTALISRKMGRNLEPASDLIIQLKESVAIDTLRNEYLIHRVIHEWLKDETFHSLPLDQLNQKVYAELFMTPDSDPWLGLNPPNTYGALNMNGVVCR